MNSKNDFLCLCKKVKIGYQMPMKINSQIKRKNTILELCKKLDLTLKPTATPSSRY